MREPPFQVRVLGHPAVMVPVMGWGMFVLYQWTQHPEITVLAIAAILTMGMVAKAAERRMEFVRWRRAWDAMAEAPPAAQGPMLAKLGLAVILLAGFFAYDSGAFDGLGGVTPVLGLATLLLLAGAMMLRRRWGSRHRARPASRSDVVGVCARPVIAVPSMTDAYSALPPHCWHVLNSGRS